MVAAGGLLACLDEPEAALQVHALRGLLKVVDQHWAEVSAAISRIEAFAEDDGFSQRELASLLASKVFYHLGELNDALTYALGAGALFDVNEESEFVTTLLAKAIDQYVELRNKPASEAVEPDARLVAIVERMFDRCFADRQFQQAIGIALESRRLDKLEQAVVSSGDAPAHLAYALRVCQTLVTSREFRRTVLRVLVKLYQEAASGADHVSVCQCLMFLDDAPAAAALLERLIEGSEDDALMAYQVAFDLFENDELEFLQRVAGALAGEVAAPPAPPAPPAGEAAGDAMDTGDAAAAAAPPAAPAPAEDMSPTGQRRSKLRRILSGDLPTALALDFLSSRNAADLNVLKALKAAVEPRNSVCHGAVVLANALAHAGTTCDTFLREHLDWLARATNWAKFAATAGLGVIHRGHVAQGRALMAPYLPRDAGGPSGGSPYSEGGALYALGLIHAGHGAPIRPFLSQSLRAASSEVVQHGACLGLGLAAMATGADDVFEDLKSVLYTDSAVAGEAAGLAMGLLLAGRASDKTAEMLAYAHDTAHEKIIRGLAVGLALTCYGREEEAEPLIEALSRDADPILRYGGAFSTGLAYRGSGNNGAIRRLLHSAVSDVSDDVRRAAVLNLGFVLAALPEQCPRVVALLAESYNAHVRYGAALSLGIACAATGSKEALALLEPLAADGVDFVRQGAYIATALVLLQQPEARVGPFRRTLERAVADKHEEALAKMGAIIATGVLDAGGRNATLALRSHSGAFRMSAFLGLALFAQHWYWFPLGALLSVALSPSALIGLNGDLAVPRFSVVSAAKASMFAYAPAASAAAAAPTAKAVTAVLSTTARAKAKAAKKEAEKKAAAAAAGGAAAMDADGAKLAAADSVDGAAAMDADAADGAQLAAAPSDAPAAAAKEEASTVLQNPARVVPAQERFIRFDDAGRYRPVKRAGAGVILLKDTTPGEPEELVSRTPAAPPLPGAGAGPAVPVVPEEEEEDAPPPAPFEYNPDAAA